MSVQGRIEGIRIFRPARVFENGVRLPNSLWGPRGFLQHHSRRGGRRRVQLGIKKMGLLALCRHGDQRRGLLKMRSVRIAGCPFMLPLLDWECSTAGIPRIKIPVLTMPRFSLQMRRQTSLQPALRSETHATSRARWHFHARGHCARHSEKPLSGDWVLAEDQKKLPFDKKKEKPPRIHWAELLRRTFLEDVLRCTCGGTRRIVPVVRDSDEAFVSLKRMGAELPPKRIRERELPPPPPDRQLCLAV